MIATLCLALHLALLVVGGREVLVMSLPMLALSVLCAGCAVQLWRGSGVATEPLWVMGGSSFAMVLVHLLVQHEHVGMSGAAAHEALAVDLLAHTAVTLALIQGVLVGFALACSRRGLPVGRTAATS